MRVLENGEAALKRTIIYIGKEFFAYNSTSPENVDVFTREVIAFLLGKETIAPKVEYYYVMTLAYEFLLKNKLK
jgi:hypothetical protein